ncbi:HET-domain-containing protein [Acephala macrosclerotiorum]|nr:HET-domain-containing protein [Acephala macrosclerotiorum]
MSRKLDPRSLVCESCWQSVFSTPNFKSICHPLGQFGGPDYTVHLPSLEARAADGCTWCNLIFDAVSELDPIPSPTEKINISLASFGAKADNFTPMGNNRTLVSITTETQGKTLQPAVFTTGDSIVAEVVTARELDHEVNSSGVQDQIHKWLMDCDEHEKCGRIEQSVLPTRVVEVSPEDHPETPRLLETKGMVDYYVALSYCWGLDQKGLTTTSNLEARYQQLDMSDLSRTLQDAIHTTRKIGMKYLWIDALCIIQDSIDDKVIELASMCKIYQNATVTIVASNASSANQGFLEDRDPPRPSISIPFWGPNDELTSVSLRTEDPYDDENEPINTRAWTLQEQLLSPRLLIYATHTLQYHCQQHTVNLGDSINIPSGFIPRRLRRFSGSSSDELSAQIIGRTWDEIVGMYSQRQLSYLEDKLTALAGVAEAFSSQANTKYLAGLWSGPSLPRLLLWRVAQTKNYEPCPIYTAPSWSWASIKSPVFCSYFHSQYKFEWYHVDVIACDIVLENEALPFGRVKSGCMRLRGYIRPGVFDGPRSLKWCSIENGEAATPADSGMSVELDDASSDERAVICLAVARRTPEMGKSSNIESVIDGIIISPIPGEKGTCRRVGCFTGLKEKAFEGFSMETVTLM